MDKELERVEVLTVEYTRPKFWHRVMANFVDFFIFVVTALGLFIGARAIVQSTSAYKTSINRLYEIQLATGLYEKDLSENKTIDIISYLNKYVQVYGSEFDGHGETEDDPPTGRNGFAVRAINTFIAYTNKEEICSKERHDELVNYYDQMRLDAVTKEGIHYFIRDEESKIIPNPTLADYATNLSLYYTYVYTPIIQQRCLPFLTTNIQEYRSLYRVDYNCLLFIEFPAAYVLAAFMTYFMPALFFRRGRMTLGKALYHIGLLDTRVLSPTLARFTARFMIFLFGELILSLFSFGIPYIISFSMMAFSKNKQGFPDYMLRLQEIDTSKANIYMDYVEAELKNELHGEAIDFKMEKPL